VTEDPRPPDTRQQLGIDGEALAERLLRRAGLRILERRFRTRLGEIDLIAEDGRVLVFVEVKARRGLAFGRPAEAVDRKKQRRLTRVALLYLQRRGWLERACRFDVVEILAGPDGRHRLEHLVDAFEVSPDF
jgi:putative endonuclease